MKNINIVGRRWFDKRAGNTYHSTEIIVDGLSIHKVPYAYGYGQQFLWTAFEWLNENWELPNPRSTNPHSGGKEHPADWCERNGIALDYDCSDVKRKKDL